MKYLLLVSLLFSSTFAFDANEDGKKDRHKSVRKAVDSFGKFEVKEVSAVNQFRSMFEDGKVTGQLRMVSAANEFKKSGESNNYASALGGTLKFELASLNGFNAAFALTTSQDVKFATGDGIKANPELSSTQGDYSQLSEAYLNYTYEDLNIRVGRQVLDTPLADSDDIRMIQNSFEAYIASYKYAGFEFLAGNIQQWQGVDAGLDDGWKQIGDNGVWLAGVTYTGEVEGNAWYYDIPTVGAQTKAIYVDLGANYTVNDDLSFHGVVQYLHESEMTNSVTASDVYGVLAESVIYGLGINLAYNKSLKIDNKQTFAGVGGGTLFTSMDTVTLDVVAIDREVDAIVAGLVYNYEDFNFLYAYGDFNGKKNSAGVKEHITEQDISCEYSVNDEFVIAGIYVIARDLQNDVKTDNDWNRAQFMMKYNF